ncbi:MAG: antitoxin VapB family protein [Thermoplasmatota archaeon]
MTKTVALSDDAYAALSRLKQEGESFSELALRLAEARNPQAILDAGGTWPLSDKDAARLLDRIRADRSTRRKGAGWSP